MGLYDYVRCKRPLPDGFTGELKTKDFDCPYLEIYTITEGGRLTHRYISDWEPVPESEWEYVGDDNPLPHSLRNSATIMSAICSIACSPSFSPSAICFCEGYSSGVAQAVMMVSRESSSPYHGGDRHSFRPRNTALRCAEQSQGPAGLAGALCVAQSESCMLMLPFEFQNARLPSV